MSLVNDVDNTIDKNQDKISSINKYLNDLSLNIKKIELEK